MFELQDSVQSDLFKMCGKPPAGHAEAVNVTFSDQRSCLHKQKA